MSLKNYVVTGFVSSKGRREQITKPLTKADAKIALRRLQKDMAIAIPKYRWVSNLRVDNLR